MHQQVKRRGLSALLKKGMEACGVWLGRARVPRDVSGKHTGFLCRRASQIVPFKVPFTINNLSDLLQGNEHSPPAAFQTAIFTVPQHFFHQGCGSGRYCPGGTTCWQNSLVQRVWDAALGWHCFCSLQRLGCVPLAQEGRRRNQSN